MLTRAKEFLGRLELADVMIGTLTLLVISMMAAMMIGHLAIMSGIMAVGCVIGAVFLAHVQTYMLDPMGSWKDWLGMHLVCLPFLSMFLFITFSVMVNGGLNGHLIDICYAADPSSHLWMHLIPRHEFGETTMFALYASAFTPAVSMIAGVYYFIKEERQRFCTA